VSLTVAQLQANVASDQASLQQSNDALTAATTAYNQAVANGASDADIDAAKATVTNATQQQQFDQSQLDTDQAALTAAQAGTTVSAPANLAPANSQAPLTIFPTNNQIVTSYATPSVAQLTAEAAAKVSVSGLVPGLTNLTRGISIVTANGSAMAVNSATGTTYANLGTVNLGNSLPPNTLPTSSSDRTQALKVTISQQPVLNGDPAAEATNNQVIFNVMPTISETRDANYKSFTPIQHPGEILKYDGSTSRTWGITARLISRNVAEADLNLAYINLMRSWTMPFYGNGTAGDSITQQYLGAPPPVLTLAAYGSQMIGPVECVCTNYNWTWPNDVDYIHTSGHVPFPVIIDVTLALKESYSPAEYSEFDLIQYRNGNLPAAFGGGATSQMSALGSNNPASNTTQSPQTPLNASSVDTSQSQTATQSQVSGASGSQQAAVTSAGAGTSSTLNVSQLTAVPSLKRAAGT
jgi:hypothetical protein